MPFDTTNHKVVWPKKTIKPKFDPFFRINYQFTENIKEEYHRNVNNKNQTIENSSRQTNPVFSINKQYWKNK